jgi:hypothetical protein
MRGLAAARSDTRAKCAESAELLATKKPVSLMVTARIKRVEVQYARTSWFSQYRMPNTLAF